MQVSFSLHVPSVLIAFAVDVALELLVVVEDLIEVEEERTGLDGEPERLHIPDFGLQPASQ